VTELDTTNDAARANKRRSAAQTRAARIPPAAARVQPPQHAAELDHLSLQELRTYRAELSAEEDCVSYWRSLVQARLDLLHTPGGEPAGRLALQAALTTARVQPGRTALVPVVPHGDMPALPELAELWERSPAPADEAARAAHHADLARAEATLSQYRTALHRQLQTTTTELIARYRDEPNSCLAALAHQRPAEPVITDPTTPRPHPTAAHGSPTGCQSPTAVGAAAGRQLPDPPSPHERARAL